MVRSSHRHGFVFFRGLPGVMAVVLFALFPSMCQAEALAPFADELAAAIENRGCVTARVSCRYYTALGQILPVEISGVVTFGGFREPFSVMTLRREEMKVDRKVSSTIIVSSKEGHIRMVDTSRKVCYEADVAKLGASLVESRLDAVFLLLMYPEIADGLRSAQGVVSEELVGSRRMKRVVVDSPVSMAMTLDAETLLPVSIERDSEDAHGGDVRLVMTFSGVHLVRRMPPEELFDVNRLFEYPREVYDPKGLFALASAPDFEADMLDGQRFTLSAFRGKPVFVCFRRPGDLIGFSRHLYLDRAGDVVRSRGGVFIDVYPSYSESSAGVGAVYSAADTCRSDVPARLYGVDLKRAPCVVFIRPDGRVGDVLSGYLPGYSEKTLTALVDTWLPPVASDVSGATSN